MVSHCQLQNYNHHYFKSSIAGCLGCRWHRYQQSSQGMQKCDVLWLILLIIVCFYTNLWFYFWFIAGNDLNEFNWYLFNKIGSFFKWYNVIFGLTLATAAYVNFLLLLCLLHLALGHQVFIHVIHRCLLVIILIVCVAATVFTVIDWFTEWGVIITSIQITAPFLHMIGVILLTLTSWILIGKWLEVENLVLKILYFVVYLAVISLLYICPLFITSPCITAAQHLPPKPYVFAHRGASSIAPENTVPSFQLATNHNVLGLETDVRVSVDGFLFLLHDETFKRTTNIANVFPDRVNLNAEYFNYSDIRQLDAGSWFLKVNPFDTIHTIPKEQQDSFINQSVPTFYQFLKLAIKYNKTVIFDIKLPPIDHPYSQSIDDMVLRELARSNISHNKILWISDEKITEKIHPVRVSNHVLPVEVLVNRSIAMVNSRPAYLSESKISAYKRANISTNIYMVNSQWLYSLYWCMGVKSVTTDYPQLLKEINVPGWLLTPDLYLIVWIVVDALSAVFILISFTLQRFHHNSKQTQSESFSLRSGRVLHTSSLNMKEKLIQAKELGMPEDSGLDFHHPTTLNPGDVSRKLSSDKSNKIIITHPNDLKWLNNRT